MIPSKTSIQLDRLYTYVHQHHIHRSTTIARNSLNGLVGCRDLESCLLDFEDARQQQHLLQILVLRAKHL